MSNATHGGKGDRQRKVNAEKYSSNFDVIFKQQQEEVKDVRKDKRKERLDEIGMLKYLAEGGTLGGG